MEFDSLFDEYQMKKMKKMKKTKGGVLGFRNLGIIDRLRGNVYNPDRPDNYNPQPGTREAEIEFERTRRRINNARRPNEDFEMIGQNEIDEAKAALQPNTNTGIEMRSANGGFFPIPFSGAMSMMGIDPMKQLRGLIGMGKNRKDILFYPKDEVSGGFLNPMTLMSLATMVPSLLQNLPLGGIFGKGKNKFDFQLNPELVEKISLKGVKGGSIMTTLNAIVNNPVVKREALAAMDRFKNTTVGQDLAEARRIRMARGGFMTGDDIVGAMRSGNTAKSLGARLALSMTPFKNLPSFASNRLLGLIGLGKNKVYFSPKDEVTGGMFTPQNLFDIATMAPSFLKYTPLGSIFGKGKDDFEFILNPELMKKIEKRGVKGGAFVDTLNNITRTIMTDPAVRNEINKFRRSNTGRDVINMGRDLVEANKIRAARGGTQYLKDFGSGFLMVNRPIASIADMVAMLPIPGISQYTKPIAMGHNLLNSAMGAITGNGDPREYRRPSHTARKEQLALANIRGVETSNAKGGYVHRPTKSNKYENMHGGAMCGNMSAVGGARSARSAIVKDVMNKRGVSMIEASKIVKNEGLFIK